jgi:NAD(P)-dependent dehydrogenase (short-subunit alcohol dehydrogenase family)
MNRDGRVVTAAEMVAGHDLSGTNAVVTGGYSGIGYETVRALAGAGARVTVAGRDAVSGVAAVTQLRDDTGNERITFSQLDLGSLASVKRWASKFVAGGAPLHILVNNAGVMRPPQQRTGDGLEPSGSFCIGAGAAAVFGGSW